MADGGESKFPILRTEQEAAEALRIKRQTLRTWRHLGKTDLPWLKFGNRVLYDEADLIDYIERSRVGR